MKRLFFLGLAIVLSLTACQKTEKRYTQQSVEIDTYKKVIDAYEKQDWEALMSHYADTAKIMNNVRRQDHSRRGSYWQRGCCAIFQLGLCGR